MQSLTRRCSATSRPVKVRVSLCFIHLYMLFFSPNTFILTFKPSVHFLPLTFIAKAALSSPFSATYSFLLSEEGRVKICPHQLSLPVKGPSVKTLVLFPCSCVLLLTSHNMDSSNIAKLLNRKNVHSSFPSSV